MRNLQHQLSFIRELDRLKSVYRQALVKSDNNRFENSAEHSWHVCIIADLLQEYVDAPIDIQRVMRMLLIHDVVEIDAGMVVSRNEIALKPLCKLGCRICAKAPSRFYVTVAILLSNSLLFLWSR